MSAVNANYNTSAYHISSLHVLPYTIQQLPLGFCIYQYRAERDYYKPLEYLMLTESDTAMNKLRIF